MMHDKVKDVQCAPSWSGRGLSPLVRLLSVPAGLELRPGLFMPVGPAWVGATRARRAAAMGAGALGARLLTLPAPPPTGLPAPSLAVLELVINTATRGPGTVAQGARWSRCGPEWCPAPSKNTPGCGPPG
jgi:hypothetical protein